MSSSIGIPEAIEFLIKTEFLFFAFISASSNCRTDIKWMPNFFAISHAWVDFPLPGGPEIITQGGLKGLSIQS